jgi:hypothetical protein
MDALLPVIYGIAAGFVLAGLASTAFELATGRKLDFSLEEETITSAAGAIVLRLVAGPMILVEGALRRCESGNVVLPWLIAVVAAATGWSFVWGVVLIETVLSLVRLS